VKDQIARRSRGGERRVLVLSGWFPRGLDGELRQDTPFHAVWNSHQEAGPPLSVAAWAQQKRALFFLEQTADTLRAYSEPVGYFFGGGA